MAIPIWAPPRPELGPELASLLGRIFSTPMAHNVEPVSEASLAKAGAALRAGALVAFPTETVYGLGADATNAKAVARIFAAKGRPSFNPLIVHVADLAAAERLVAFTPAARTLARTFWPGPLTLVLARLPTCPIADLASAGGPTLAVRVPAHETALALIRAADRPLAAPSANRSGRITATRAEHVAEDLGDTVEMILDDGATRHGLESTVVDVSGAEVRLLRPGAIAREALEAALGHALSSALDGGDRPLSPGQLESHYAPAAPMRLNALDVRDAEALLAFGPIVPQTRGAMLNLSPTGDLIEAAAHLFEFLRTLDKTGARTIAVMPIPETGLGEAINDRLRRAAAPRP